MDSVSIQKITMWITWRKVGPVGHFSVDNYVDGVENQAEYALFDGRISMHILNQFELNFPKNEKPIMRSGQNTEEN